MSLSSLPLPTAPHQLSSTRKRTNSFSYPPPSFTQNPRPTKAPKTMASSPLCRTQSLIFDSSSYTSTTVAHYKSLSYHRDAQRLKRRNAASKEPLSITTRFDDKAGSKYTTVFTTPTHTRTPTTQSSLSSATVPVPVPLSALRTRPARSTNPFATTTPLQKPSKAPQVILPSPSCPVTTRVTHRTSSPLSPTPKPTTPRPVFPRSKAEPDLYKTALKGSLKQSPDGQRVLHMGARLAMSIFVATRELERLVAMDRDAEGDVVMADVSESCSEKEVSPVLTSSWVMVRGDDWEMVECAA
ncbi:hypothetical protein CVT24_004880 [Panaeolus cyanescens]|uniref:Uncharacterized protein n=1 Tax=Panaeolus cyanescens TaxID=181874 RepID=A0A409V9X0_9AGAR|nr:hypothetical protein CVT24_004880 [Panaeolus cyanescens]